VSGVPKEAAEEAVQPAETGRSVMEDAERRIKKVE